MRRSTSEMLVMVARPPALGLKNLFDRFLRLLTVTDTTLAEFISSSTLLTLGVILVLPQESLIKVMPLSRMMLRFAPEATWAALFLACGLFQSLANLSRNRSARRGAAFCAFVFYGFIGGLGASVTPISLLGACFKVQAFGQGIVYLQLGVHSHRGEQ